MKETHPSTLPFLKVCRCSWSKWLRSTWSIKWRWEHVWKHHRWLMVVERLVKCELATADDKWCYRPMRCFSEKINHKPLPLLSLALFPHASFPCIILPISFFCIFNLQLSHCFTPPSCSSNNEICYPPTTTANNKKCSFISCGQNKTTRNRTCAWMAK